jgi:hypothetical protein
MSSWATTTRTTPNAIPVPTATAVPSANPSRINPNPDAASMIPEARPHNRTCQRSLMSA